MGAPDPRKVARIPGRLAVNPKDLTLPWPHGGSGLGVVGAIALRPRRATLVIPAEGRGIEPQDALDLGESYVLTASLRTITDPDALVTLFPNTAMGPITGARVVESPGAVKAGARLSARAVALIFTPNDPRAHFAVLMRRALPIVDPSAELRFTLQEEVRLLVSFLALRSGSPPEKAVALGFLSDLRL